jgi:uncharacterized protein (TIGR00369 family)
VSTIDRIGIRRVAVERTTVISGQSFDAVLAKLAAAVGHPDVFTFARDVAAARTQADLERIVNAAIGSAGLMEMAHFDIGDVLRKELGNSAPKSVRLVIGNPLIMKDMVKHVPDAASYAPVTVLIDERAGGVYLSYDLMASFLAPYENAQASAVARQLDEKILALLTAAAGGWTARNGPQHANPMGTLHGGILCDVADAAIGMAFVTTLKPDESFTATLRVTFFRPVWEARLRVDARVVNRSRNIGYLKCDITDHDGKGIAKAISTCAVLRGDQARTR